MIFLKSVSKETKEKEQNKQEIPLSHQPHTKSPPKSKVASKLNLLIGKETQDTNDSFLSTDENEETHRKMILISISLVIHNQVQQSSLVINSLDTIESVIIQSIYHFNTIFQSENTLFRLNNDHSLYGLNQAKKNGFPKNDMPSFDINTPLKDTNQTKFSLVWKANPDNHKDYFITFSCKEKRRNCKGCVIF